MNETTRLILRAISPLLTPPLFLIGWMVENAYAVLVGPFEERFAVRSAVQFKEEIVDALGFVVHGYGGEVVPIVPKRDVRGFDYVEALIRIGPIRLYVSRCRGDFSAFVAPEFDPSDRQDLCQVLDVCNNRPVTGGYFRDLWDLGTQFQPHVNNVLNWLTREQYPELKRRLDSYEIRGQKRYLKALEDQLNRRLYGK